MTHLERPPYINLKIKITVGKRFDLRNDLNKQKSQCLIFQRGCLESRSHENYTNIFIFYLMEISIENIRKYLKL